VELRRAWVTACATAEAVGMTAAALAWTVADRLDEPAAALSVVVVGGLVEGLALGALQGRVLARRFDRTLARRWAVVTTVVASLGWAAGSAPSVLATSEGAEQGPPLGLVLLGAGAMGVALGSVLGAAQSLVLRGRAVRPWRWTLVSALAWAPTMVVVFTGAGVPSSDWPTLAVVATASLTGALAGAVLGVLTQPWLPAPLVPGL
jgi:hypothetical protein